MIFRVHVYFICLLQNRFSGMIAQVSALLGAGAQEATEAIVAKIEQFKSIIDMVLKKSSFQQRTLSAHSMINVPLSRILTRFTIRFETQRKQHLYAFV